MQNQRTQIGVTCPNCNQPMQGYSIGYHSYKCSGCGTEVNRLTIMANNGLEQVIGVICFLGLVALVARILE